MSKFGLQLSRRFKEQVVCELSGLETCSDGVERDLASVESPVRLIVTVLAVRGNRVTLAFNAPPTVKIHRSELFRDEGAGESYLLTLDADHRLVEMADDDSDFRAGSRRQTSGQPCIQRQ